MFAAMCLIWGLPYLFIRVVVEDNHLTPGTLVFLRTALASAVLLPIGLYRNEIKPVLARWKWLIVFAVIELAHTLGLTVVAEGVETAAQHAQLASLGCDSCQGYYFSHPMPAADLDTLMNVLNQKRAQVWQQQPDHFLEHAIIEGDGTLGGTTGECKQGMDLSSCRAAASASASSTSGRCGANAVNTLKR